MSFLTPPELGDYDSLCWIPCVSGRLNFSNIDLSPTRGTKSFNKALKITPNNRWLVATSDTNLQDFGFDDSNLDGNFWGCFFVKQKDKSGYLFDGRMIWWPRELCDKNTQQSIIDGVDALHRKKIASDDNYDEWNNEYNFLGEELRKTENSYCVSFRIEANGLVFLKKPIIKGRSLDEVESKTLMNQTFYSLKQCLHKHKHHDNQQDAITLTHSIQDLTKRYNKENLGFGLIEDVRSSMVTIHRSDKNLDNLKRAQGYQSYVKSLINTLEFRGLITECSSITQKKYFDNVSESISILADKLEYGLTNRRHASTSTRVLFLGMIAFLAPILVFLKDRITEGVKDHSDGFKTLDQYSTPFIAISTNWAWLVFSLVIIVTLLFIWWLLVRKFEDPIGCLLDTTADISASFKPAKITLFEFVKTISKWTAIGFFIYILYLKIF